MVSSANTEPVFQTAQAIGVVTPVTGTNTVVTNGQYIRGGPNTVPYCHH